ncbi:hypothetical protein O1D97_11930 [Marinomonas sp. 15G1-11]|uniref:Cutinase n=1 Tax=Marinomonas phaeophyticola TaxID=3004091 RepID=A0ABT4JVA1_9GAMM|nr:hypothetical protein [Marinomonas sp. 15G1-11]MCZ2722318.1 hypothetical protein [Marinomonas sp. 15G1-11]
MTSLINRAVPNSMKHIIGLLLIVALYAPMKDIINLISDSLKQHTIELTNISFGGVLPWQESLSKSAYQKVSTTNTLSTPQLIYTKLKFTNPTNKTVIYRDIWLNFEHENGALEYTTDYNLYDMTTRSRLVGRSIELGPNSSISVLASYRFIPSYPNSTPKSVTVSWEGENLLRNSACNYSVSNSSLNSFSKTCL